VIRPPTASEVTARYGIQLRNCNNELGRLRFCDAVLVLDTNVAPWSEFFVRAQISVTPDSNWKLFALEYRASFNVIVYGNNRLPIEVTKTLVKPSGLFVDTIKDTAYYIN
jgi:hypothetical protein